MMVFGHAGITLGAATLLSGAINSRHSPKINGTSWWNSLGNYVDIRILLLGSILPDIIDKPVGQYLWRDTFSNGRIFSHTLLFLILIAVAGFSLYKLRHQVWLLTLASGTLMHLILDEMWFNPHTLFWPIFGFTFDRIELTGWIWRWLLNLISIPSAYIPELLGLIIILWFVLMLAIRGKVGIFIRYGRAE